MNSHKNFLLHGRSAIKDELYPATLSAQNGSKENGVQYSRYSHFNLPFEKQMKKVRYNVPLTTLCRLALSMSPGRKYLEMSKEFTEPFQTDMLNSG